jgi:hypothetical protein
VSPYQGWISFRNYQIGILRLGPCSLASSITLTTTAPNLIPSPMLFLTATSYACVELAQRGLLVPLNASDGSARGRFSSRVPEDLRIAHHLGAQPQGVHSEAGYSTAHRLD